MKWRLTLKTGYLQNTSHHRYQAFLDGMKGVNFLSTTSSIRELLRTGRTSLIQFACSEVAPPQMGSNLSGSNSNAKWIKLDLV